jgi:hypothetical protein
MEAISCHFDEKTREFFFSIFRLFCSGNEMRFEEKDRDFGDMDSPTSSPSSARPPAAQVSSGFA